MKFKFDFSIRKLLNNKKIVAILSVVLAFVFWMVLETGETPTIEQTISKIPVTLDTEGTVVAELGLDEITGVENKTVSVKISGPAYILSQINANDIEVSASVSDVTKPGQYDLVLTASKKTFASEYKVLSITPGNIQASFDYIDTKQFTLETKVVGVSATEGLVAEDPVVSDAGNNIVTVKAPRTEMDKIASVVAYAEANEVLSVTKSYDGIISLYDSNGNELDISKYSLSATSVKISVPISKTKTVPLVATFKNEPDSYKNTPIPNSLSVSEVTIIGPEETINATSFIELSPIDFNSIEKSKNSFEVSLVLPNGVKTLDKLESVTVKINTNSLGSKNFSISNVAAINNNSGYNVSLLNSIKNVKICGPSGVVYSLNANDLYAVVDISGKTKGEYTMAVTIKSNVHTNIWQVGTYQATVKIE